MVDSKNIQENIQKKSEKNSQKLAKLVANFEEFLINFRDIF